MSYQTDLAAWRTPYLLGHLRSNDGSVAATARALGVSVRTVWRWVDEHSLDPRAIAAEAHLAKIAQQGKTQAESA